MAAGDDGINLCVNGIELRKKSLFQSEQCLWSFEKVEMEFNFNKATLWTLEQNNQLIAFLILVSVKNYKSHEIRAAYAWSNAYTALLFLVFPLWFSGTYGLLYGPCSRGQLNNCKIVYFDRL